MKCRKCASDKVSVQAVSSLKEKENGCLHWIYWLFIGWWFESILWVVFTIAMILIKLFGGKAKSKTKIESYAVCQECGHKWKL